jgi:hypothetical protein
MDTTSEYTGATANETPVLIAPIVKCYSTDFVSRATCSLICLRVRTDHFVEGCGPAFASVVSRHRALLV